MQAAAYRIESRIGKQKSSLKIRELLIGDRDVALNGRDCDWQRLSVEVADGDRSCDERYDVPARLYLG